MILIFLIAMSADYSFYVRTIETHAHAFLTLNILAIGSMEREHSVFGFFSKVVKKRCKDDKDMLSKEMNSASLH